MKGDILVQETANNIFSKIISFVTNSSECHCALCINNYQIIEATFSGVKITPISNYKNYRLYRVNNITPDQIDKAIEFCKKELGHFYDFGAIIYLGCQFIIGERQSINKWDKDNRWFCSELLDAAFSSAGVDICPNIKYDNVTPGDIARSKKLFRIV